MSDLVDNQIYKLGQMDERQRIIKLIEDEMCESCRTTRDAINCDFKGADGFGYSCDTDLYWVEAIVKEQEND